MSRKTAALLLPLFFVSASAVAWAADLIRVSGRGERKFAPDIAVVSVTAWGKGKSAQTAQDASRLQGARLEKILTTDFKVARKDLKTQNFSLTPEYRVSSRNEQQLIGYESSHSVEVTLRDIPAAGNLMDSLASVQGADKTSGLRVDGVSFGTDKWNERETETIEAAMTNAKTRAEAIARAAGRNLKGIRSVAHGGGLPVYGGRPMTFGGGAMKMAESAPATSLNPGELTVTAEVTVEYEF